LGDIYRATLKASSNWRYGEKRAKRGHNSATLQMATMATSSETSHAEVKSAGL
jgi:hypothetical protein